MANGVGHGRQVTRRGKNYPGSPISCLRGQCSTKLRAHFLGDLSHRNSSSYQDILLKTRFRGSS